MSPTLFLAILCLGVGSGALALDPNLNAEWHDWKKQYEKSYTMVSKAETNGTTEGPMNELALLLNCQGQL
jgi:cathepsin R